MRLIYLALGWVAGIVLVTREDDMVFTIWLLLVMSTGILALLMIYREQRRLIIGVLFIFILGAIRALFVPSTNEIARLNGVGGLTIEGIVITEPDIRDDRVLLRVDVETVTRIGRTEPIAGRILVEALRPIDIRFGDRITATGALFTPQEFDTFSYRDFLARQGVFSMMDNAAVEVLSSGHGSHLQAQLIDLKHDAQQTISDALPDPQAALLTGILLGNERGISPEVADAFRSVGASHVIAISGFNMAVMSGVFVNLLRRTRLRNRAALIGVPVIIIYTIFVGADAAVVRAAVMSSLLMVGMTLRRKTFIPASLGLVVIVMSFINPTVLTDVGFQLSFFAVLGMMLFADPFSVYVNRFIDGLRFSTEFGGLISLLCETLVVTLAVQITVLPVTLLHFQQVSLVALPVNLLIVPVQAIILFLGGAATLLSFLPQVSQVLYWFDYIALTWTVEVVRAFSRLSFAEVDWFVNPVHVYTYLSFLIAGAIVHIAQPGWAYSLSAWLRRRAVVTTTSLAAVGIFLLTITAFSNRPDGDLHVWMLDMGHSNAVLIQTPDGAQMLVDGGRFPSRLLTALGDRLPFTDREIDVLVVTHPDIFDIAVLASVLERYDVGVVLTNGQPNQNVAIRELDAALAEFPVVPVTAGYSLGMDDGTRIEILNPQRTPALGESFNEHVIVLRVIYENVSFLLTSDLSIDGQRAILNSGQQLFASVMQLPQHGTTDSLDEAFLEAVQPQVIVLQSDAANRRNDPDPDTLSLLDDEIPLFRTDEGGTIHLFTDGHDLWVQQDK
ncbi:MAG: ComEC/Rec2 family competence protein [Chloroflexi bacterium]|nr:MAG: hypothetical protein CUN54_05000 [Phototrophicales bacterium]RMF78363.1 MAG: ComEC/Rec2 family competence protein [Chloroflexota bacterium]